MQSGFSLIEIFLRARKNFIVTSNHIQNESCKKELSKNIFIAKGIENTARFHLKLNV